MTEMCLDDYRVRNMRLSAEMYTAKAVAESQDNPRVAATAWRYAADCAQKFVLGLREYASVLREPQQTPETPEIKGMKMAMAEWTERIADTWQKEGEEWREKAVTLTNRKSNGG